MSTGVVALVAAGAPLRDVAASFEEEGVPLLVEEEAGEPEALARRAAARSPLGLGVGADGTQLVLVLAAAPGVPYLRSPAADARAFGRAAARVAARRPIGRLDVSWS